MPGNIGKSSTGANSAATADNWQNEALAGSGFRYTAGSGESVTSVHVFGDGTGTCEVGVYEFSGGVPTTRIGTANISVGSGAADYSTTVNWSLTNGTVYVVAIDYDTGGASWNIRYDTGQGTGATSIGSGQGALPATWSQSSTSTDASTVWAVVESAGSTATPAAIAVVTTIPQATALEVVPVTLRPIPIRSGLRLG